MKQTDSINEFKHVIKIWKPDLCSCKLCKVYLQNIGYLQSAKKRNIYVCKNTYMSSKIRISQSFFPFALRYTFTFTCLVIFWNILNLFEI